MVAIRPMAGLPDRRARHRRDLPAQKPPETTSRTLVPADRRTRRTSQEAVTDMAPDGIFFVALFNNAGHTDSPR